MHVCFWESCIQVLFSSSLVLILVCREQVKCRPKAGYMKKQPDITNSMRAILVDWLVEVGEEYKLQNETLYLAVNYIDRFLSSMSVLRGKLQLVGTAAMLLASWVFVPFRPASLVLLCSIYGLCLVLSFQEVWRDLPPRGGRVCLHHWRHLLKEASVKNGASGPEGPVLWSGRTDDRPVSHAVLPQAASLQQSRELVHGEWSCPRCGGGFGNYWTFCPKQWLVTLKTSPLVCLFSPQFLGELSLVDADPFLKYLPSQMAAAAFILANYTITGASWVSWIYSTAYSEMASYAIYSGGSEVWIVRDYFNCELIPQAFSAQLFRTCF